MKQLTKEQMFDLFKIAIGAIDRSYQYLDEMGVNSIQIHDTGFAVHHFSLNYSKVDVRFGEVYDFYYNTTDLNMDNSKFINIVNHKLLHEKLIEFGFYELHKTK